MKKYNQFINENLLDKMSAKTPQEIRKSKENKEGKDNVEIIRFLKYMLTKHEINHPEELYSLDEIKDYMKNQMSIIGYNGAIRVLGLESKIPFLYPDKKQILELINELKEENTNSENPLLQFRYYLKNEFKLDIFDYIDINKLEIDIQKKKEQD